MPHLVTTLGSQGRQQRSDDGGTHVPAPAAGALATLVPGAGDCAPIDEAIEDALG